MKITQFKLLNAYDAASKLVNIKLPFKKSYAVYTLIKEMEENRAFYAQEEKKLIEENCASIDESGRISFEDAGSQIKFMQSREELNNLEIDLKYEPITLIESDLGGAGIAPLDMIQLEELIIFE